MLSAHTRLLTLLLLAVCGGLAVRFHRKQNAKGTRGGRISGPKVAWLFYAVYFWFLVCPLVALDANVLPALRWVLGLFAACMWLRGLAELYMLYVARNWKPPYGVGHDVLCILLVLGTLAFQREGLRGPLAPVDAWALALVGLVLVTLVVEVVYASLFFHAVEGATTGEDGIWFADEEQARFRRINRLTLACNVPLYLALGTLLVLGLTR